MAGTIWISNSDHENHIAHSLKDNAVRSMKNQKYSKDHIFLGVSSIKDVKEEAEDSC